MSPVNENAEQHITTILCVDDDAAMRDVLAMLLRCNSYAVETAVDGMAAWQLVADDLSRFDVVITDNQMPHLDGIGLVKKLRSAGYPGKIIVFSSTFTPADVHEISRLRIDAVVEKGSPASELMESLTRVLKG